MSVSPRRVSTPGTGLHASRRPATIAELAGRAQQNLWDASKGLKHWLRTAEKARRTGQAYVEAGEYEAAFIEFAKAATIVLEKLPTHPEYQVLLNTDQRHNLGMNGQDILDSLSQLKPILVQRCEQWDTNHDSSRESSSEPPSSAHLTSEEVTRRRRENSVRAQEEERARHALEAARREEEWKRDDLARRHAEDGDRRVEEEAAWVRSHETKRKEAAAIAVEARRAAEVRGSIEHADRVQWEEDERMKRRVDEKRRQEQEGIARRQQEAEMAARAARRDIVAGLMPSPSGGPPQSGSSAGERTDQNGSYGHHRELDVPGPTHREIAMPVASPLPSRPTSSFQKPAFGDSYSSNHGPPMMPLESPTRYEDDTDAEGKSDRQPWHRPRNGHQAEQTPAKSKHMAPGIVYPPPLTTTSPAPPEMGVIRYPSLMSQHQLKQGYVPSLQSMFSHPTEEPPTPKSSLLFDAKSSTGALYTNLLPKPSAAVPPPIPPYPSGMPVSDPQRYYQYPSHVGQRGLSPSGARPPPPLPRKEAMPPPAPSSTRIVPGRTTDSQVQELKTIKLPRECLPRFLSIARVNTLQNRETCGLLLGKDKGNKYIVTTLLIPKQRSTSDTCTMDEEELVLQFTEERHLITLGWIHTHPTQSCFMSSVDLHTHSGFQRMLPESFAVVCAPSSSPTFGIFRLTDPDGLQTILSCRAKEAFHPHPELPIYTDCDNCHVQMKEIAIEIVDLR